jgi:hypothetical protein
MTHLSPLKISIKCEVLAINLQTGILKKIMPDYKGGQKKNCRQFVLYFLPDSCMEL